MAKVSIIVPVYNVEKYIDRCINSLVNQTLQDIEIIIINDGSQDNSRIIIEKYVKNYSKKIKFYQKENGGLSSARNYGIKYATGEYIAFLDSDDYVEKEMYEEMYKLAKKENSDMVECDFIWEWEFSKKIKKDTRREYKNKKEMMRFPRVVAWNKLIKREKIKELFPEGLIYEDLEFFFKLIPFINKFSYINKYFVHYTQRNNSISNIQNSRTADIFKIINNIFEFYKKNGLYEDFSKELKYMKRRILLGSSMKRILKIRNKKLRKKLIYQTIIFLFKDYKEEKCYKKKICFGITKLSIGGAERVLVDLVNKISTKFDITIFTIYSNGELEKELNENIKLISLYKKENKTIPIYVFLFRKHIYSKYIKNKFDLDIAFLEGSITRIFSYSKNNIAWVHNDISEVYGKSVKANIKRKMDKFFYKKYKNLVFVSKQNKEAFEKLYGKISNRRVIYNYIDKNRILKLSNEKCARKN